MFSNNQLIGYNHRQVLIIELDNEAKPFDTSIFAQKSDLFCHLKMQAMQAVFDIQYPKKGLFSKVHTIQESVDKYELENEGKVSSRAADLQNSKKLNIVPDDQKSQN